MVRAADLMVEQPLGVGAPKRDTPPPRRAVPIGAGVLPSGSCLPDRVMPRRPPRRVLAAWAVGQVPADAEHRATVRAEEVRHTRRLATSFLSTTVRHKVKKVNP